MFFLPFFGISQQDPQFSQNMFNQMATNPGFAGSNKNICATAINRQQWLGFDGAPQTTILSVDAAVVPFGIKSGVGLNIVSDQLGFSSNFKAGGTYAYRFPFLRGELGIGTELGIINKTVDGNFNPRDNNDATIPKKDNDINFDMSFGAFYKDNELYAGLSVSHVNQANFELNGNTVASSRRHYFFAAGYNFTTPVSLLELKPSLFVKSDGRAHQINLNANVLYNKKLWGGISYRWGDAIIGILGIELFNGIKIGYSYDLSISKLSKYNQGTHEVMVGYCFNLGFEQKTENYNSVRFL